MYYALLAVAAYHGLNGVIMMTVPQFWYLNVPGVVETGPANNHFIHDIGLAFIAAAVGLLPGARDRTNPALLVAPALFLGGHAMLHLVEMAAPGASRAAAMRDLATIVLPGLLPAFALALRSRHRKEAL